LILQSSGHGYSNAHLGEVAKTVGFSGSKDFAGEKTIKGSSLEI
jgi:hypothetical protein